MQDFKTAFAYFTEALTMYRAFNSDQYLFQIAIILNNIGDIYEEFEEFKDKKMALKNYEKALQIFEQLYPDLNHPHLAFVLQKTIGGYLQIKDVKNAIRYLEKALKVAEIMKDSGKIKTYQDVLNSLTTQEHTSSSREKAQSDKCIIA